MPSPSLRRAGKLLLFTRSTDRLSGCSSGESRLKTASIIDRRRLVALAATFALVPAVSEWQTRGGAVMRSAIFALASLVLAGSLAAAQPSDGRLKIIHETTTLRVAYRTDSRPFSYVDAQGRPVGYTIELCERIAKSLEAQLNVALTIKWVPVDQRTRFDAIVNDTADMECGSTTVSLSRMKIVDFSS